MLLTTLKRYKYEILVFAVFVLFHLPTLGYDMFNTDVWKWKQRSYDFGSAVFSANFEGTIQKYHPGVTLMWLGALAVKVVNLGYDVFTGSPPPDNDINFVFTLNFAQVLFVVLAVGTAMAFIFYGLKRLFSLRLALIAVALISLEPFYVGLTRTFHLEGLMSTFMVAAFVWLVLYLKEKNTRTMYISAVFASLAFLTKTTSLFLLLFAGLLMFLDTRSIKSSLKTYWRWLVAAILVFVLVWPAMWVEPLKALAELWSGIFDTGVDTGHIQLYFGQWMLDPGPWFYFVVLWLRTSLYIVAGVVVLPFIYRKLGPDKKKFIQYGLIFAVLYFIEMTIPSKKLDRYLLPTIMMLSLLSAFSFEWVVSKAKSLVGFVIFVPLIIGLVYLHPDYLSYYSPIGVGLEKGMFMIEPKWTFGQQELMKYFQGVMAEEGLEGFGEDSLQTLYYKSALQKKLVVSFPEKYYTQLYPFLRKIDGWAVIEAFTPDAEQSGYFVFPVWDDYATEIGRFRLEYKDSVYLRGVPIYNVYTRYDK